MLIGQYYDRAGAANDGLTAHRIALRDDPPAFLRGSYDQQSPDGPEHFGVVYAKTVDMISTEPRIALTELGSITAPTLALQGDRDEVRLEHSAAVTAAIPEPGSPSCPARTRCPSRVPVWSTRCSSTSCRAAPTTSTGRPWPTRAPDTELYRYTIVSGCWDRTRCPGGSGSSTKGLEGGVLGAGSVGERLLELGHRG